jgi:hypothetical protein
MDENANIPEPVPKPDMVNQLKCPEIPELESYRFPPPGGFWNDFPTQPLPTSPSTPIDIQRLQEIIELVEYKMTLGQKERAKTLLADLGRGVSVKFESVLPPIRDKNSPSVIAHGREFTDILASWIKKGYVAGPFRIAPLDNFRSNSMLAIEQPGKIRAIMNIEYEFTGRHFLQ